MLLNLIRRDWMLNTNALLWSLGLFCVFQCYAVSRGINAPMMLLGISCVWASVIPIILFTREDRFRAVAWLCSLPVTRGDIVRARYIAAWVFMSAALLFVMLLLAFLPGSDISPARVFSWGTIFFVLGFLTFVTSVLLPFTIRYGFMGVLIFLVGAQVLGALVLVITTISRKGGEAKRNLIREAIRGVSDTLMSLKDFLSPTPYFVLLAVVFIAINYGGYRLALTLFRSRQF